jgi:hypothetical protein
LGTEQLEPPPQQPDRDDDDVSQQPERVLTFAELKALIESGREDLIPNNKVIPDALNVRLAIFFWIYVIVSEHSGL